MRLHHLFADPVARQAVMMAEDNAREAIASLTPQQLLVIGHVIEGKQNKTIAHEMGLSIRTVENHRSEITSRLNVKSVSELSRLVMLAS